MSSITSDVAELESLVESLQAENRILHNEKVQHEFEIFELKRVNDRLQTERDEARGAASTMKLILDQAGAAIVHGMKAYHAGQRDKTQNQMGEEPPPLFLQKDQQQTVQ